VEEGRHCRFITFNFEASWEVTLRRISSPFVYPAIDEPIDRDSDIVDSHTFAWIQDPEGNTVGLWKEKSGSTR